MNKSLLKAALVAGAASTVLALGAGSASAAVTFTVKAGNAANGVAIPITGTTQGTNPQITFVDATTGTTLNCASATAPGNITPGTGLSGTAIASIKGPGTKFNGCTGPLGLVLNVTGAGVWKINAFKGNSTGVTLGNINNIKATVASPDGSCKFTVTGAVQGTYSNATQTLILPGTVAQLKLSAVSGCFGAVANGDLASFQATFKVTANRASYNPIKITAP